MSRLPVHETVSDQAAEIFTGLRKKLGKVPNMYAAIGSNSPAALAALVNFDAALAGTVLSKQEIEVIKLTVSEVNGCDYCVAAHTVVGKLVGLSIDATLAARQGTPSGDPKLDALSQFVRTLVSTSGTVPADVVETFKAAGYSDAHVVDSIFAVTTITFTNLINRVNDTVLDFPAAPAVKRPT